MASSAITVISAQARALIDDDLMAGRENFRLAQELAQKATATDPTDGEAWAVLARVLVETWGRNYDSTMQLREQARSAVDRATRLAARCRLRTQVLHQFLEETL